MNAYFWEAEIYLKFPKPSTWSLSVKAAFTDTKRIIRFTTDIPAIGATNHQTTDSYTDNQQLDKEQKK